MKLPTINDPITRIDRYKLWPNPFFVNPRAHNAVMMKPIGLIRIPGKVEKYLITVAV